MMWIEPPHGQLEAGSEREPMLGLRNILPQSLKRQLAAPLACAALLLALPQALHATTINAYTYSFTFSGTPPFTGSGTFTIDSATAPVANTNYNFTSTPGASGLVALTFTLDSQTFTLNSSDASQAAGGNAFISFSTVNSTVNGVSNFHAFNFMETIGTSPNQFRFGSTGTNPTFTDSVGGNLHTNASPEPTLTSATLTSITPLTPAVTPEPASIFLLGTGLIASAGGLYRRARAQRS
jgi:hypothetical protein